MNKLMFVLLFVSFGIAGAEQTFSKQKIKIGKVPVTVEVADTDEERAQGLMNREKLEPGQGMLFIFPDERPRGFWMKNTLIPLSIAYFDKSKKLIKILDMEPAPGVSDFDLKVYKSDLSAQYALEVPKGWFARKRIRVGDVLVLQVK